MIPCAVLAGTSIRSAPRARGYRGLGAGQQPAAGRPFRAGRRGPRVVAVLLGQGGREDQLAAARGRGPPALLAGRPEPGDAPAPSTAEAR